MKRSRLERKTPLRARVGLRRRPKRHAETSAEREARFAWHAVHQGWCSCGCNRFSMHLQWHHVLTKERLKRENRHDLLWDPANAMPLHPDCHERHTNHSRKIPIEFVPVEAMAFAVDVLGEGGAAAYFASHYNCEVTL